MKHKQTQQGTQSHKASREEQHFSGEAKQAQSAQREPAPRRVYHCANCDIEFFWPPTIVQGKTYCCTGCAAGGPCNCDYSLYRSVTIMGVIYYEQ